ncbi:MAG: hypothetical protein CMN76_20155 [Spirochaetaceae bacterium]|nr:hypothetical protein [Spirochaetaceae bacterium]|tara:strand:+ start:19145 stop:19666 length:522 start_codon:yes stop_codon:yes gene_type:complete
MEKEDLELRRKWVFKAGSARLHLIKKPLESSEHVFLKAFVWALFRENYNALEVEKSTGDRYKPDVICLDPEPPGQPIFWAEAGQVKPEKVVSILRRFPGLHFLVARWGFRKEPLVDLLQKRLMGDNRIEKNAPRVELLQVSNSAHLNCIENGRIGLTSEHYRILPVWPLNAAG